MEICKNILKKLSIYRRISMQNNYIRKRCIYLAKNLWSKKKSPRLLIVGLMAMDRWNTLIPVCEFKTEGCLLLPPDWFGSSMDFDKNDHYWYSFPPDYLMIDYLVIALLAVLEVWLLSFLSSND